MKVGGLQIQIIRRFCFDIKNIRRVIHFAMLADKRMERSWFLKQNRSYGPTVPCSVTRHRT